jgi:HlyD family secretion protein
MFMSETPIIPTETDNVQNEPGASETQSKIKQLDASNMKKVLLAKRIKGMSTKQKIVWAVVVLLLVAASGFGIHKYLGSKTAVTYSTATISKGTVTDSIETTGTLGAVRQTSMGFKNDDTIIAVNVKPGDHVSAGQVLAKQDPATLNTALRQAQSTVEQDQVSVESANLTNETNLATLNRQQQLFDAGALAQADLDTAKDTYTKSGWDIETAQSKLSNDQAKLEQAQADLAGATLIAPYDGIIGVVNAQVGSINGIDSSTSTLLTIMSNDIQLSALVNEADIGRIKVGQDVEFTSSSFSNKTFTGKVMQITPQATTVSSVQYYPVLISCDDPNKVLMSGMSVSANIIVSRSSDTLTVPMMAVTYGQTYLKNNPTLAANFKGSKVVVVLVNNQPVVKAITLGISDGSNYAVSDGLNEGDNVILGANQTSGSTSTGTSTTTRTNGTGGNTNQLRGGGGGGGAVRVPGLGG